MPRQQQNNASQQSADPELRPDIGRLHGQEILPSVGAKCNIEIGKIDHIINMVFDFKA